MPESLPGISHAAIRPGIGLDEAIRKALGPEPAGATLRLKSLPRDSVAVSSDDPADRQAVDHAFRREADAPQT